MTSSDALPKLTGGWQIFLLCILLGLATACQTPASTTRLITLTHTPVVLAAATPVPALPIAGPVTVRTLRPIDFAALTPGGIPASPALPTPPPVTARPVITADPAYPTADWADDPALIARVWARLAALADVPGVIVIGTSLEGRPLLGQRIGTGERVLLLIAAMHGGWEINTAALAFDLIDHFSAAPEQLPPGTALLIVPAANPDGLVRGAVPAGRFNAAGVDLNRNWGCGWSAAALWRTAAVSAGASAFSEPEARALAEFIQTTRPAGVLSYHSAAGGVFPGSCAIPGAPFVDAAGFSAAYAAAAALTCCQPFSAYPVTGSAPDWIVGQGIPAADVELWSHTATETAAQIAGVRAALAWLAAQ